MRRNGDVVTLTEAEVRDLIDSEATQSILRISGAEFERRFFAGTLPNVGTEGAAAFRIGMICKLLSSYARRTGKP